MPNDQDPSRPVGSPSFNDAPWHPLDAIRHMISGSDSSPNKKEVTVQKTTISASPNAMPEDIRNTLQDVQNQKAYQNWEKSRGMKKGGKVKPKRTSASTRGDGIASKGHTRGKYL
jgi:hypothetical protein